MRQWVARWFRRFRAKRGPLEPVQLAELLRPYPGQWVAIKNGEVVEISDTPDRLVLALSDRDILDATIIRAPAENEPELVGLG